MKKADEEIFYKFLKSITCKAIFQKVRINYNNLTNTIYMDKYKIQSTPWIRKFLISKYQQNE